MIHKKCFKLPDAMKNAENVAEKQQTAAAIILREVVLNNKARGIIGQFLNLPSIPSFH